MKTCSLCTHSVLEVFSHDGAKLCDPCYRTVAIKPLQDLEANVIRELSRIKELMKRRVEVLAKKPAGSGNLVFTCDCGQRFQQAVQLAEHTENCAERIAPRAARLNGHPATPKAHETYAQRRMARNGKVL